MATLDLFLIVKLQSTELAECEESSELLGQAA